MTRDDFFFVRDKGVLVIIRRDEVKAVYNAEGVTMITIDDGQDIAVDCSVEEVWRAMWKDMPS